MNECVRRISDAADAVSSLVSDDARSLDGTALVAAHAATGDLRRVVDGLLAELSAEIDRRSRPELGADGLARKNGYRNAGTLVSAATGSSRGEAQRMIQVGAAAAPRPTLTGETRPPKHPHVGAAIGRGGLSVDAASLIVTMLDRVELRAESAAAESIERALVAQAPGLTLDQLAKLVARAEAHLDPDGLEPKLERLHHRRSLTIRQEPSGMVQLIALLDPESAAPVKAAIEGIVTAQLRRRNADASGLAGWEASTGGAAGSAWGGGSGGNALGAAGGAGAPGAAGVVSAADAVGTAGTAGVVSPTGPDPRSIKQMQADALVEVCRHLLGCDTSKALAHATTTVIVRVDLETLQSGAGIATIDGVYQPVSAGAARRMAASAQVIPCVLGGDSEILDWGRSRRLFTHAQRLALLERDGGCAFCGAPPGFTEAHHIRWWERHGGRTDLSNGVMLCSACHHRIHADGWGIHVEGPERGAAVWFDPPAHIDPARTPRLGGRRRFDLVA